MYLPIYSFQLNTHIYTHMSLNRTWPLHQPKATTTRKTAPRKTAAKKAAKKKVAARKVAKKKLSQYLTEGEKNVIMSSSNRIERGSFKYLDSDLLEFRINERSRIQGARHNIKNSVIGSRVRLECLETIKRCIVGSRSDVDDVYNIDYTVFSNDVTIDDAGDIKGCKFGRSPKIRCADIVDSTFTEGAHLLDEVELHNCLIIVDAANDLILEGEVKFSQTRLNKIKHLNSSKPMEFIDAMQVTRLDGSYRRITLFLTKKEEVFVHAGCFFGTLKRFVTRAAGEGKYAYVTLIPAMASVLVARN